MKNLNVATQNYTFRGTERARVYFLIGNTVKKGYDFPINNVDQINYVDSRIQEIVKSNKYLVTFTQL